MKMTTKVATLVMWASLYLTMAPAHATLTVNGLTINGSLPLNGASINGITLNGISMNGAINGLPINGLPMNGAFNGLHVNGISVNGMSRDATPLPGEPTSEVQHESLSFHGLSQRALGKTPLSHISLSSLCSYYRLVPLCL